MRTTPKIPIELAWDEYVASMEGRLHGQTDAFKFAWKAAKKEWVGLTDDEMEATFIQCGGKWNGDFWKIEDADFHPFLRTIEAKLKEKNT